MNNHKGKKKNPAEYEDRPLIGPPRNHRLDNSSRWPPRPQAPHLPRQPTLVPDPYAAQRREENLRAAGAHVAAATAAASANEALLMQGTFQNNRASLATQDLFQRLLSLTMTTIPQQVDQFRRDSAALAQNEEHERKKLASGLDQLERIAESLRREHDDTRHRLKWLEDEVRKTSTGTTRATLQMEAIQREGQERLGRLESAVRHLQDDEKAQARLTEQATASHGKEFTELKASTQKAHDQLADTAAKLMQMRKEDTDDRRRIADAIAGLAKTDNGRGEEIFHDLRKVLVVLKDEHCGDQARLQETVYKKLRESKSTEDEWKITIRKNLEEAMETVKVEVRKEQAWRAHLNEQLNSQIGSMGDSRRHADNLNQDFVTELRLLEESMSSLMKELDVSRDALRKELKAELNAMKEALIVL